MCLVTKIPYVALKLQTLQLCADSGTTSRWDHILYWYAVDDKPSTVHSHRHQMSAGPTTHQAAQSMSTRGTQSLPYLAG